MSEDDKPANVRDALVMEMAELIGKQTAEALITALDKLRSDDPFKDVIITITQQWVTEYGTEVTAMALADLTRMLADGPQAVTLEDLPRMSADSLTRLANQLQSMEAEGTRRQSRWVREVGAAMRGAVTLVARAAKVALFGGLT